MPNPLSISARPTLATESSADADSFKTMSWKASYSKSALQAHSMMLEKNLDPPSDCYVSSTCSRPFQEMHIDIQGIQAQRQLM